MRLIIAGSRGLTRLDLEAATLIFLFENPEIVYSGKARGIDTFGEQWAKERDIPVRGFPAQWNEFGKGAGFIRNVEMAEAATHLLAVWDGESRGTKHMIDTMVRMGKKVWIHIPARLRKMSEAGGN